MNKLALILFLPLPLFAQFTPPPSAAYISNGSGGWTPATTTDTAGQVSFTPPATGVYCFNSGTGKWVPATSACLGGGGGGSGTVTNFLAPTGSWPSWLVPAVATSTTTPTLSVTPGIVPVANGGTGTSSPALVQGTNITITGSWPNQTINATGTAVGGAGILQAASGASGGFQATNLTEAGGTLTITDTTVNQFTSFAGALTTRVSNSSTDPAALSLLAVQTTGSSGGLELLGANWAPSGVLVPNQAILYNASGPILLDTLSTQNIVLATNGAAAVTVDGTTQLTTIKGGSLVGSLPIPGVDTGSPTASQVVCIKAAGPPISLGTCSTIVGAGGACTCQ